MWTLVKMFLLTLLVLLLVTIAAEGYFDNTTDGFRPMENLNEKHFRREKRSGKEPRFLSFETKNNNIEVSLCEDVFSELLCDVCFWNQL